VGAEKRMYLSTGRRTGKRKNSLVAELGKRKPDGRKKTVFSTYPMRGGGSNCLPKREKEKLPYPRCAPKGGKGENNPN